MGARTHARPEAVHHTLPPHQVAARQAEHRLRPQHREVEQRRLLHARGQRRARQGLDEGYRAALELGHARHDLGSRRPRVGIERAVIVAHGLLRPRLAVGEVPREEEDEAAALARRYAPLDGQRRRRVGLRHRGRALGERAVGAEVVPEVENRVVPVVGARRGAVANLAVARGDKGHRTPRRVGLVDPLGVHIYAAQAVALAVLVAVVGRARRHIVALPVGVKAAAVLADEVAQAPAHGDIHVAARGVLHLIHQHRNGQ